MRKTVLIVLFLFGLILVISAGKGKRLSSINDEEMIQHPRMPNVFIRKRFIQSFLDDGPGVITNCCVKCKKRCACCIT